MSEEIIFRSLNQEQQERFYFTMLQVITACGFSVNETSRLEQDICQQFSLLEIGHVRPEQVQEIEKWMVSVWITNQLERHLRSIHARQIEMMKEAQTAYLLVSRQRTLLANHCQRALAVVLTLCLILHPLAVRALPVTPPQQDPQIIVQPYSATDETNLLQRAQSAVTADPFPVVEDADLIVKAVNFAGNYAASVVVDRVFLEDCVDGFPMAALMKAKMRLDAAVLTEIPGTNYSPVIYTLATMDQTGDLTKGPLMVYFGSLLGPKAFIARSSDTAPRVPSLGSEFGLIWQNGLLAVADSQHRGNNRSQDDCVVCIEQVKANAARVRDGKVAQAGAVAVAAGLACAAVPVPFYQVLCFAAAAAALIGALKTIHAEYDEKIFAAQRGLCAINRQTGQSCQWER